MSLVMAHFLGVEGGDFLLTVDKLVNTYKSRHEFFLEIIMSMIILHNLYWDYELMLQKFNSV